MPSVATRARWSATAISPDCRRIALPTAEQTNQLMLAEDVAGTVSARYSIPSAYSAVFLISRCTLSCPSMASRWLVTAAGTSKPFLITASISVA